MDNYKEQILLVEMEKACLALGPEAFMELVQETYERATMAAQDEMSQASADNFMLHKEAVTVIIDGLEDSQE